MEQFTEFNKSNLKDVRQLLVKAFDNIFQETGIKIDVQNITFTKKEFHTTVKAIIVDKNSPMSLLPVKMLSYKESFRRNCWEYGMVESDFNRCKIIDGKRYMVVGIETRSRKYPIVTP
jgi:hypothetical protein